MNNDTGPIDDEQLLKAISKGESWAMAALYDRYARLVFSLALRMLGEPRAAEEMMQEVLLKVWRSANTYDRKRGKLSSWLLGIAHNQCVDELRRRRARPPAGADLDSIRELPADTEDPLTAAAQSIEHARAVQALARISPDQRTVIELAYYRGLAHSEIAEKLGLPLGTVKTRLRLGLLKLREILQDEDA